MHLRLCVRDADRLRLPRPQRDVVVAAVSVSEAMVVPDGIPPPLIGSPTRKVLFRPLVSDTFEIVADPLVVSPVAVVA